MPLKISENSIFAMLMRRSWWVSALASLVTFLLVQFFVPWAYALFCTLPFIVITLIVAWNQAFGPNGARVAKTLESIRTMSWEDFAQALERGYKAEGYTVRRVGGVADLELEKMGYLTLVSARRWKSARLGVEPLRALQAARQADDTRADAPKAVCICLGGASENAAAYAREHGITLWQAADVALVLRGMPLPGSAPGKPAR